MKQFDELGLDPSILKSIDELGFKKPSPIQEKAIPFILENDQDLIALAQTGTGKTAAFGLPVLSQIKTGKAGLQLIILCPTRELCLQISKDLNTYAKEIKNLSVTPVYGGERIDIQIRALKKGTNIVVGTPGRVHDLIRKNILKLSTIKWVVLDEADEMLDMGFKDDLDAILAETPKKKQTLLFSATMSTSVRKIANEYMSDIQEISVGGKNTGADNVTHEYVVVNAKNRFDALKMILDNMPEAYGILFCRTRNETQKVSDQLKQAGYDAECLHGDISQAMRTKIMNRFKKKQIRLLVATDVAARGIDVNNLSHVINYNLPDQDSSYTHRSGRTGRADKKGTSISIITPREERTIRRIEDIIGKSFKYMKVPGSEDICESQINYVIRELDKHKEENELNGDYDAVIEKLKKYTKEELIKFFLQDKLGRFMRDYNSAIDINAAKGGEKKGKRLEAHDAKNIKVNFGKKQGMDAAGLFALLNSNKQISSVEVGKINVMVEYTLFSVEKNMAEKVVSALNGGKFRGKKVIAKLSDKNISEFSGGGGRRRSDRGPRGDRRKGNYKNKPFKGRRKRR